MVLEEDVPIADNNIRAGVVKFLENQPNFNIRTTSVYTALQNEAAFTNIDNEQRTEVINQLKILQRVQAISPIPEAVPVLMNANLNSAFTVTEMPESTFLKTYDNTFNNFGKDIAQQIYTNALNNRIRNEQALMAMREAVRGTGLAIMDGSQTLETRMANLQKVVNDNDIPLNLEELFGDMDYCECEECSSVYSPASYFVELLQFLRNNNLDPNNPYTGQKGIDNTPLEKLFRRRPDLGCLELTCENTFTVLPYVDLVNEVIESFVVHNDPNNPKQATLETFNVDDETSGELLAQPQHTNYQAYDILKNAVYPFSLPYHQPIDAIRIFLNYLETSRYELQDTYRIAKIDDDNLSNLGLMPPNNWWPLYHHKALEQAVDAEFLGLTLEEYILLTLNITQTEDYGKYYGYKTEAEMLNTDKTAKQGLTFVKKQFLPRTGIQYLDLVELLKTQFINPRNSGYSSFERIAKLIVLDSGEELKLSLWIEVNIAMPNHPVIPLRLEIGSVSTDGTIKDRDQNIVGKITLFGEGKVIDNDERPLSIDGLIDQLMSENSMNPIKKEIQIRDEKGNFIIALINDQGIIINDVNESINEQRLNLLSAQDPCNLEKVNLIHLDGTKLEVEEYDRIHRFIRLWQKMDWTIDETDKALIGLNQNSDSAPEITPDFLHQLVAVKKLLDKTGLELTKLLTFWADISTNGEKSLYERLFLSHNLLSIDEVFKPDRHGNYLTESAKISEHLPILMAGLRLKADDITAIAEFRQLNDELTLANVSELYRHSLLAKVLGIKVSELLKAIEIFGNPFENAEKTLEMLDTWGKMEDAGFTFSQLNYIICDRDDALRPLAPSQKTILQITKTLYDGLNKIEEDHPLITEDNREEAAAELMRAKAGLLFEQSVAEQIIGLLEGTTVYTTNAPANQTISVPDNLAAKIQYKNQADADPPQATLQVTGILTDAEQEQAKTLSSHPQWAAAFERIAKQAENFFNDVLFG
ncbi:MAG: Tc toxin subunit A, partial [Xenococcaceae cyanobacterium MO_207.B15]|nr:Tc toxin subunit A [Xenococcaceae cyanobacterium MO_207.B15]